MVEDYVTLIWKAYEWPGGRPTTTDLAERLAVTASTVSANLKKLARDGYIDYEAYGQITLTEQNHRLLREMQLAIILCPHNKLSFSSSAVALPSISRVCSVGY